MPDKPKWTPGRMVVVIEDKEPYIDRITKKPSAWVKVNRHGGGAAIATCNVVSHPLGNPSRANAERIAACWNAMEGIGNPEKIRKLIEGVKLALIFGVTPDGPSANALGKALAALELEG